MNQITTSLHTLANHRVCVCVCFRGWRATTYTSRYIRTNPLAVVTATGRQGVTTFLGENFMRGQGSRSLLVLKFHHMKIGTQFLSVLP